MHNQPLNYLRQASAELQQDWLPWISKSHPQDALACQKLLHDAHGAVKFLLPCGGRLLNDRLRGLPEVPRLPFPAIVLEYESDKHGQGIVEQVYERTPVSCPRRIVVAWHEAGSANIFVRAIFHMDDRQRSGVHSWTVTPYAMEICCEPEADSAPAPVYNGKPIVELLSDGKAHDATASLALKVHAVGTMAERSAERWWEAAYLDMLDEVNAVLELIEALSCSNVRHEALPVRKLNKGAARRGALPFDEYRVLTVAAPGTSTGEGGQHTSHGLHRSPREHLRRGHIRIYANGRRIWINPTLVNAGVGGKISTVRDLRARLEG